MEKMSENSGRSVEERWSSDSFWRMSCRSLARRNKSRTAVSRWLLLSGEAVAWCWEGVDIGNGSDVYGWRMLSE